MTPEVGQTCKHLQYGEGTVTKVTGDLVFIRFAGGVLSFQREHLDLGVPIEEHIQKTERQERLARAGRQGARRRKELGRTITPEQARQMNQARAVNQKKRSQRNWSASYDERRKAWRFFIRQEDGTWKWIGFLSAWAEIPTKLKELGIPEEVTAGV
jgi:hypothetical protein